LFEVFDDLKRRRGSRRAAATLVLMSPTLHAAFDPRSGTTAQRNQGRKTSLRPTPPKAGETQSFALRQPGIAAPAELVQRREGLRT
jgi:hypothetical protein